MHPIILGIDKRWFGRLTPLGAATNGDGEYFLAVLVAGEIGDYACYVGLGEDPFLVAKFGDKISFEEACAHFPGGQLERLKYRL